MTRTVDREIRSVCVRLSNNPGELARMQGSHGYKYELQKGIMEK